MMKRLGNVIMVVMVLMMVWFVASWFEICLFNTSGDPQYSAWNLFQILVNRG